MATALQKKLATGKAKEYYQMEDSFEAWGTRFVNWDMHYTAAGPQGVWLCGNVLNNTPIIIGLVDWDNINRMVVDKDEECVYIELKQYETLLEKTSKEFKNIYKKDFVHPMSDTGLMALCLPMDLFSGNILYYLQNRVPTEFKAEPKTGSEKKRGIIQTIVLVVILLVVVVCFFV